MLTFIGVYLCLLFPFAGCSDDDDYKDVDGQVPNVSLATDHIQTAAGRSITLAATISDNDGISAIRLECADLNLDKTIDIIGIYQEPLKTYELEYKFNIKSTEIGERFTVVITVTDVGGRTTSQSVLVTMDGDFQNPIFVVSPDATITVLLKAETRFSLNFSVSDDRALDYITIEIPGIDGYESKTLTVGGSNSYDYSDRISLPNVLQDYNVTLTAYDMVGNSTVARSVISVSELQDFTKMYLADVATAAELNSDVFGVPMLIDHTGEYQYRARYYNAQANTEIYFLPQKGNFTPICFGLDPDDNSRLTDDPDLAEPIVLEQANVYYDITFNTMEATYAISTYTIAEAIDPLPHAQGSINLDTWADGGSWLQEFYIGYMTSGPREVTRFAQDAVNPHLFYLEDPLALEAGTQMNFLIHNWHSDGWWNYCTWRVDSSTEPEAFNYYGNFKNPLWTTPNTPLDNWTKPTVNVTGNYKLWFDAHLGRGKLVRVN